MPLFMEHGSTVPYGLVWAFNGECILNAVATQFTLNILDGRRLVLAEYFDHNDGNTLSPKDPWRGCVR